MQQLHYSIPLAMYLLCLAYKLQHSAGVATMHEYRWTCPTAAAEHCMQSTFNRQQT